MYQLHIDTFGLHEQHHDQIQPLVDLSTWLPKQLLHLWQLPRLSHIMEYIISLTGTWSSIIQDIPHVHHVVWVLVFQFDARYQTSVYNDDVVF
jgi:hypothetical protein